MHKFNLKLNYRIKILVRLSVISFVLINDTNASSLCINSDFVNQNMLIKYTNL